MALTFGQMTAQILLETYRDDSFSTQVQNAIVSAIKELETEELFINQKFAVLTVPEQIFKVPLPEDFISVLTMTLVNNKGNSVYTAATGFKETTMFELITYRDQFNSFASDGFNQSQFGIPGMWALYENDIHIWPAPAPNSGGSLLHLYYYFRDGTYPVEPDDTSIWMDDFTQDVTRYTARGIFYRDSLQSPELAASDMQKAQDALSRLKIRNSQRENMNNLSY
jgi:hypothetical protein